MRLFSYVLTLKHDAGFVRIRTVARNKGTAISMVMQAERCPRTAIVKTERV